MTITEEKTYKPVCTYTHISVIYDAFTHTNTHRYTYTQSHIHIDMHSHTHTHAHTHTHRHTHKNAYKYLMLPSIQMFFKSFTNDKLTIYLLKCYGWITLPNTVIETTPEGEDQTGE